MKRSAVLVLLLLTTFSNISTVMSIRSSVLESRDVKKTQVENFIIKGVNYSPYLKGQMPPSGEYPSVEVVENDFQLMVAANINTIRTYDPPPEYVLDLADKFNLSVVEGIWIPHEMNLSSTTFQEEMILKVKSTVARGMKHKSVIMYIIGNEIPHEVVLKYGKTNVENFLETLADVAKGVDPESIVTYGNWIGTIDLDLSFLDIISFNVYIYDEGLFETFLLSIASRHKGKSILIMEFGTDDIRFDENQRIEILRWQWQSILDAGALGGVIFEFSDEWWKAGYPNVQDNHPEEHWGIVDISRTLKPTYFAVKDMFGSTDIRRPKTVFQIGVELVYAWQLLLIPISVFNGVIVSLAYNFLAIRFKISLKKRVGLITCILLFLGLALIITMLIIVSHLALRLYPYYIETPLIYFDIIMNMGMTSFKLVLLSLLVEITSLASVSYFLIRKSCVPLPRLVLLMSLFSYSNYTIAFFLTHIIFT